MPNWEHFSSVKVARNAALRATSRGATGDSPAVRRAYVTFARKDMVISVLRGELAQRNDEILRREERERETNILIRGLQNLFLQLQPG